MTSISAPRSDAERQAARLVGGGDAIVTAAHELLGEEGLDALTVRAVLERAQVNRRTFYERFSGKDDLMLAVFEQSLQSAAVECRRHMFSLPDPLARVEHIVRYLVQGVVAHDADLAEGGRRGAALCREHMRLAEARPEELRRALRPLIGLMSEQLAAGVAAGQVRDVAPERLAAFVYNLVSTTVHAEVVGREGGVPDRRRRERLAGELWEFCRRGIAAD